MYGLLQTIQAPFQFVWCSAGLGEYVTGTGLNQIYHLAPSTGVTGGVYASATGVSPNTYYNQKGSLTYSLVKTGATSGTLTTAPPYNDGGSASSIGGSTTNYNLTITDNNTGQKYSYLNSFIWGPV